MKRRKVQFDSFAQMLADVEHLKRDGYQRVGNWDLGTICCHIADAIERSMDGFLTPAPFLPRLFSPIILPIVLKTRRIPSGVKVAKEALPKGEQDVDAQLSRLHLAAERYDQAWRAYSRLTRSSDGFPPRPIADCTLFMQPIT